MYPEFIAIYIMLAVVILMLGAVIFLLIKVSKNASGKGNSYMPDQNYNNQYYAQQYQPQYQQQAGSVVFCKNCATQFDASQPYCPNCGAMR